jgi:hypothetical protein
MDTYYLHPSEEACHRRSVKGSGTHQEESPRPLSNPHQSCQTKACIRISVLTSRAGAFLFFQGSGIQRAPWRSPKITEAILHRVLFPAIGTAEVAVIDTALPHLPGQQDQSKVGATPGASHPIGKEEMHP